jgi:hypothetical protein
MLLDKYLSGEIDKKSFDSAIEILKPNKPEVYDYDISYS